MRKFILGALILVATVTAANAGQWDDALAYVNAATQARFPGGLRPQITNLDVFQIQGVNCDSVSPAPVFSSEVNTTVTNFDTFGGCDQVSPINIEINQFARQQDLVALQTSTSGSVAALQTSLTALGAQFATTSAALAQALQVQARESNRGIAEALAMAGTADLQSDEHYAVAFNVGTFGGQSAFAAGAAARIDDHVSINAGFTAGTSGGPVGARAGIRFGW